MKTVLMVKFAFAALIVFWVLSAVGAPRLGLDLAAALGIAASAWTLRKGQIRPMELGLAGCFLGLALLDLTGTTLVGLPATGLAVPVLLFVQGTIGVISCAIGRPWTAVYASAAYGAMKTSPVFLAVNMVLSLIWSAVFFSLAAIAWFRLGAIYSETLTGVGMLLSIFGPSLLVRLRLARAVRAQESYHWPTPTFAPRPEGSDAYDVAVVGAGIGGLTAAALLAESGLKVVVAEHHVVPGGYAHTWLRKVRHEGIPRVFRFDSGVHDVSGAQAGGSVHGLLARLGISLDWVRMTQTMETDAGPAPIPEDWRDYARALGARYPTSAEGLMRFFEVTKDIYDGMFSLGRGQFGVPLGPNSPAGMLAFAREFPIAIEWMQRPFRELVAQYVQDPAAQKALYAPAGYVTDRPEDMSCADMVPIFGYYFYGGYYPKGGSGVLGSALAKAVTRFGGDVLLKSPVAEILVEEGAAAGIRLASGRVIKARAVVSNADLKRTFLELLPKSDVPGEFRARIEAAKPAASAFMVRLGLVGQPEMPPIAHATFDDGSMIGLIAPSVADPTAAPEGYGTLELITLIPNDEARDWFPTAGAIDDAAHRRSNVYLAAKAELGDRMIAAAEALIPNLRERIVMRHDASPITFARYDWASDGSIYGVAKADRFKGVKSPIPGLYLAGACNMGPGVEAVAISGAAVANSIVPGILKRPAAAPAGSLATEVAADDESEDELALISA